jgi:hypothetical protein
MTTLLDTPVRVAHAGSRDRLFYGGMAMALAATVFAGFGSTYYFRFFSGGPTATLTGGPFTTLVHTHGALFTAWVMLFVVQTALISTRRVAVHRRLGLAGAGLAAAMVVVGALVAIATAKRGASVSGMGPLAFLAIPLFDLVLFVAGAIYDFLSRRRVHPVYVWGGLLLVLSIPVRLAIANSAAWQSFAAVLVR